MSITYKDAGVDTEKAAKVIADFVKKNRVRDPAVLGGIGGFAACYDLNSATGLMKEPLLVTCCDGVGTKLKLALDWNCLTGLGQDLVAMSLNDMVCVGAKPLQFLDYFATSQLNEKQILPILEGVLNACTQCDCALVGGETAEMPGLYNAGDFDLAGFGVGIVDKSQRLGPHRVVAGDILLAVESSGPHSNGYSLIRKIVEQEKIKPADNTGFSSQSWSDALLAPTMLYHPPLRKSYTRLHAAAHITGGGIDENLPRVIPEHLTAVVSRSNWKMPALFEWLGNAAGIDETELTKTFNCGVGMILICSRDELMAIQRELQHHRIASWEVGEVSTRSGDGKVLRWV